MHLILNLSLQFEFGGELQSFTNVVNLSRDRRCFWFVLPVPSGNGNLGWRVACGTAFTSVRISISVSLLVRAQGSGPCGPVKWVFVLISLARRCTRPERA